MIIWIAPVLGFLRSALPYALLFLRSIPDLLAPKPTPAGSAYTPPFAGGQMIGVAYRIDINATQENFGDVSYYHSWNGTSGSSNIYWGAIQSVVGVMGGVLITHDGGNRQNKIDMGLPSFIVTINSVTIYRADGSPDTGGNTPNPIPPPPIADDGLFNPSNPPIGDDNGNVNQSAIVLAPALPLVLVSAILAGYSAAMAAAAAASDALAAIKKIAEGLDALKTLWEKLKEFLDEWEKNRPKKRDVVRQTYGRIIGDGALDFFPNNNTKFQAIQLDVVITNIPVGFGRYFGSLSPSRYRYKELGYIAFYSVNQGILEVHSIQFKRTSYQIPELAIGFIYHLGLDEQVKGYAFGTFSVEKT